MEGRGDPNKETSERKEGDLVICKSIKLREREGECTGEDGGRRLEEEERREEEEMENHGKREREKERKGKKSRRERKKREREREGPERSGGRGVR